MTRYRVIKEITDGWETGAKVGDILYRGRWQGDPTLFLDGKAVCDTDSPYAEEHCELIEEERP